MFELAPIIKSLWRKPTGPLLLIIQLAISIAIISNALAFITQRYAYVSEDPGFNVEGLISFQVRQDPHKGNLDETITRDMAYLPSLSAVTSSIAITGIPLSGIGSTSGISTEPRQEGVTSTTAVSTSASIVRISEQGIATLGARIVQGRDFHPGEYLRFERASPPQTGSIVITQALAKTLFPDDENVLGKIIYEPGGAFTIVGVIEDMFGHFLKWEFPRHVIIFPHLLLSNSTHYLVRVDERAQTEFLSEIARDFRNSNKSRILDEGKTMEDIVYSAYAGDHAMIKILSVVLILLVGVNALGVFGLTSFWVGQRRKHIGIRRALGASRIAIMRYFIVENIILVVCAVSFGALAAITTSMYMVKAYSFSPLPWIYIPLSGLLVLLITLSAAIVPVRKASYIAPVEAVAGK